jgi:hypothetical protein
MLWIMIVVTTGIAGGKMADIEHRSPWIWGTATAVASYALSVLLGVWFWFAPFATLIALFAALWFLKSRDDARRGGGKVVR